MATLNLTSESAVAPEALASEPSPLRVGVHDASRVEWSVSLPLPTDRRPVKFAIEVRLKVPENAFVEHAPWKQLQHYTRLDGPQAALVGDVCSIDELRRNVLASASRVSRESDAFSRHCRLASALFATARTTELDGQLTSSVDAAVQAVDDARERLTRPQAGEADEVARERRLVDEYLSVRLLEMLGAAERSLGVLSSSRSPHAPELAPVVAAAEARLGQATAAEFEHRAERGYVKADPSKPKALETYLHRTSQLKKHFQEVLFLDAETVHVVDRLSHLAAALVAVLASTWAFGWQLALLDQGLSAKARFGSGLTTVALVAGLIYATKDRLKEVGRNFLAKKLNDVYDVQRLTRFRAPSRRLRGRDVIVSASECFKQSTERLPDPLNPESGASVPFSVIVYKSRGTVRPQRELLSSGVRRVKHVFRYDLSPFFGRLDDATKPVPVLCPETRKVRFIDAPKAYRLPFEVRVTCGARTTVEETVLVVHKRGLDRVERADEDFAPLEA
ncbi:MAG: hypothetical protein IPK71_20230 [Myxococcales bacterium]|jgi:hypothetical protein|nr:hypothetical protein [Myxococcales bacterium]